MQTTLDRTTLLPQPFDLAAYRHHNPGLAGMSDAELAFHYSAHGAAEGRRCSAVYDRASFLGIVPRNARILEIGPFWAPAFRRPVYDVAYIDVLDTAELQARAEQDPNAAGAQVPEIDYVWRGEPYRALVDGDFDVVYSSHNIEHQPNLIGHLRDVAAVLRPSGLFLLTIPDQRYCFDHFMPPSDIGDVLEAHMQGRTRHRLGKVLADQTMHAHNDPLRHWMDDHGTDPRFDGPSDYRSQCILRAMAYEDARDGYVDAHAWQFTPASFGAIVAELQAVRLVGMQAVRIYPTVFGSFEFYAVLQKV